MHRAFSILCVLSLSAHVVTAFNVQPCALKSASQAVLRCNSIGRRLRRPLVLECTAVGEEQAGSTEADSIGQELQKLSRDGKTFLSGTRWLLKLGV
jgi:hypothetical protein